MQTVSAAFTAEEKDVARKIAQNLQMSWKKFSTLGNRTFTIGVSLIGGNDVIGLNPGAIGSPGNYRYFDESDYVLGLAWERGLNMPTGGLSMALAEAELDNTSGRFTPRHMGGNSELFTSVFYPRRPMVINAGFEVGGVDLVVPQFAGITTRPAEIDTRSKTVRLRAADYVDFFQSRALDQSAMFTGLRTDEWLSYLFGTVLGMSTAQYDLDTGINIIPFGYFPTDTKVSDAVNQLVQAENAQLYQDESGIFKFENRQHWDSSPYTDIQRLILTGQVLEAQSPDNDHIINVVEIKSQEYAKQPLQVIVNFNTPTAIAPNGTISLFFEYENPALEVTSPTAAGTDSYYVVTTDGTEDGTDVTSSVSVKSISKFAQSCKIIFQNNSAAQVWLIKVVLSGRTAKPISDIYTRVEDDSSMTAYEPKILVIENPFIQNPTDANSLGQMILNDFAEPEKLQKLTIRAIPELQLGDLISWQGRYWRIFDIKSTLSAAVGFIQELTLLQRQVVSYFRIGISTIGGSDKIAP